jgi:hypothetical protein
VISPRTSTLTKHSRSLTEDRERKWPGSRTSTPNGRQAGPRHRETWGSRGKVSSNHSYAPKRSPGTVTDRRVDAKAFRTLKAWHRQRSNSSNMNDCVRRGNRPGTGHPIFSESLICWCGPRCHGLVADLRATTLSLRRPRFHQVLANLGRGSENWFLYFRPLKQSWWVTYIIDMIWMKWLSHGHRPEHIFVKRGWVGNPAESTRPWSYGNVIEYTKVAFKSPGNIA